MRIIRTQGLALSVRAGKTWGTHKGALWSSTGTELAELTFTDGAPGWTTASFDTPVAITAGTTYVASYYAPNGHYSADLDFFTTAYVNTPLQSVGSGGVFTYSNAFPNSSFRESNYYVDVIFDTSADAPPGVSLVAPSGGQDSVALDSTVSASFNSAIAQSTLNMTVTTVSDGVAVPGQVDYVTGSKKATFTPASALTPNTRYRATVTANSSSGVAMAQPKVWEFTTTAVLPASVGAVTPVDAAVDVDITTKVTAQFSESTKADSISLKLAKGSDNVPGALTYDAATRVATFTPSDPLASGTAYKATATASNTAGVAMTSPKVWSFTTKDTEPVTFGSLSPANNATSVARTAKVTAVASKAIDQSSLVITVKNDSGATVAGATTYNATSRTVTFTPSAQLGIGVGYTASISAKSASGVAMASPVTWSFATADTAAPVVSSTTPANSATAVPLDQKVTATFAKAIDQSSLTMSLSPAAAGTVSYDAATRTATFTPNAPLTSSTKYTASVRAKSTGGTNMSSVKTWAFTTTTADYSLFAPTAAPATQAVTTTTAITVGMRFSSTRAGKVVAIKFWAAATNTGTTVTLRNATTGAVLGTATTADTGTGWRTATFSSPISITAGTAYVASYYAPAGRWAVTNSAFSSAVTNGPLTVPATGGRTGNGNVNPTTTTTNNMWVDVIVRI